jgi:hypothetical protein
MAPSIPFGYVLHVALKHLGAKGGSGESRQAADAFGEWASDIVASLDIEHYCSLTPMFQTHETLPE